MCVYVYVYLQVCNENQLNKYFNGILTIHHCRETINKNR